MRTTLTLDDDLAAKAKALARQQDRPLKQVINEALRTGLSTLDQPPAGRKPFRTRPMKLGLRPGLDLDNIGELLDQVEGPAHK